ncbi:MAG: ABC transporter ATP-binding protein [Oscillospiraceae bacterium]|nr:ABC transporter ATP-binding protein [Oscillospiraceae bacterium]
MKRMLKYLKPYRGLLLAAMALISVSSFCDLLLPTLMSNILDRGIRDKDGGYILLCCGEMLLTAGISLGCILWGSKISAKVVSCFCGDLRSDIFRKVNTLSFEEFGHWGTAALVTRATHDVMTVSWVASMLCGTVATIPMLFIGGVVLSMAKDVVLSLILLTVVPVILAVVLAIGRKVLPLWKKSDEYIDRQNAIMRERLRGIRVIRAFRQEDREHDRIAEATEVMAENIIKGNVSMGILMPLSLFLFNVATVLIVYFGSFRMGSGQLSAGDIFAVTQYVTMIMAGIMMGAFALVMYPHAKVAAGRIGEVFDAEGMGNSTIGMEHQFQGSIRFENVSFSYGGSEDAVKDISLEIQAGQKVSVIGGTGSGKSTLISLLLGFRRPCKGTLFFDGVPATDISKASLRRDISSVLQGSAIYTGTIRENIRMGKENASEEELMEATRIAQLAPFVEECGGLDYQITQAGKNLSGGQKQRLSIARAIVKEAPIYIFDDSFSALDFLTEKNLRSALNEKIKGKTQIVVTQRITSAMSSDCIFVMDKGILVDQGKHEELLKRCKIYQEIFASQTGGGKE